MTGREPVGPAPERVASQRVRVGLTGLAFVFLLVMLATTFLGFERGGSVGAANQTIAAAAGNANEPPQEPLADLGVAPGNAPPQAKASKPAASPPSAVSH